MRDKNAKAPLIPLTRQEIRRHVRSGGRFSNLGNYLGDAEKIYYEERDKFLSEVPTDPEFYAFIQMIVRIYYGWATNEAFRLRLENIFLKSRLKAEAGN